MDLNSLLKDMGLVDAFSTTLNQVDLELGAGECSDSCRNGCSDSCHDGCSGGNKGG
jgi:hypothetical protein